MDGSPLSRVLKLGDEILFRLFLDSPAVDAVVELLCGSSYDPMRINGQPYVQLWKSGPAQDGYNWSAAVRLGPETDSFQVDGYPVLFHAVITGGTRRETSSTVMVDIQQPRWGRERSAVDRRTFICGVTSLACSARTFNPMAAAASPEAAPAANEPLRLRIGFLGAAYSHAAAKLRLLRNHPDFELVGAWDDDSQVRDRLGAQGVPVLSPDEVLSRSEVIAVESIVRDHARYARLALAAGRHVHLEKPPSTSLQDFQEVVQLARDKQLVLQCGYQFRHHPGLNAAMEAVQQGWLGDVFMVRATINNHLAVAEREEWDEFPGGVMFELGSHMIDAVVRLLGKPVRVTPFLHTDAGLGDRLKDNTLAVLEYPRAIATVFAATMQPSAGTYRALEILGTQGTATLRPLEPPTLDLELVHAAGPYPAGMHHDSWPAWARYEGDFVELAAAVRGEKPPLVSLDQELEIHETLLRASHMT